MAVMVVPQLGFKHRGSHQVQAGGYFIKLTNDITFCSNNTTALPVFPGLNK